MQISDGISDFGYLSPDQFRAMQATRDEIGRVIAEHRAMYYQAVANPLNYVLETNRDAMDRLQNLLEKDERDAQQLEDTLSDVWESGDQTKYEKWMALANTIVDGTARKIYNEQANYASTAETAKQVFKATVRDLKPSNWPSWLWLAVAGVAAVVIVPKLISRRS